MTLIKVCQSPSRAELESIFYIPTPHVMNNSETGDLIPKSIALDNEESNVINKYNGN